MNIFFIRWRYIIYTFAFLTILTLTSCSKDEPKEPQIIPFSQKELNSKILLQNIGIIYDFPDIDPESIDGPALWKAWENDPMYSGISGMYLAGVQIKTGSEVLYSFRPSWTPFYISAEGCELRMRHIAESQTHKTGIYVNMINEGLGQLGEEISKEDMSMYNLREENGEIFLTFPENRSDDFRMITLTITTYQILGWSETSPGSPIPGFNMFCFLQMPWTDDEAIWENIPEVETVP